MHIARLIPLMQWTKMDVTKPTSFVAELLDGCQRRSLYLPKSRTFKSIAQTICPYCKK